MKIFSNGGRWEEIYHQLGICYVEPTDKPAEQPIIDHLTKKMVAAFRQAQPLPFGFMGVHQCNCGATSTSHDYVLPNGMITNSLCIHYLALHRETISSEQLELIGQFSFGELEPTVQELHVPRS